METLKELKEKCILIAEFKNPIFIGSTNDTLYKYSTTIKASLYSDNKGKYYLYKYVGRILEYDNYDIAVERYIAYINIILKR